jgi:hypothetical protein
LIAFSLSPSISVWDIVFSIFAAQYVVHVLASSFKRDRRVEQTRTGCSEDVGVFVCTKKDPEFDRAA